MVLKVEIGYVEDGQLDIVETYVLKNGTYKPGTLSFDQDDEYTIIVGSDSSAITVPKRRADYRHSNRKPEIMKDSGSGTVTIGSGETFQIIKGGRLSVKLIQPNNKEWFRNQGLK